MLVNPVLMQSVLDWAGELVLVPAARVKNKRTSEVRGLTPWAFRRWVDVDLRGYGAVRPAGGRVGRAAAGRNVAFADVPLSSGMRLAERPHC